MAIPFLNNINLSDNQLQNAKLHLTASTPTSAEGQIYFHTTGKTVNVHNGSGWETIAFRSWATSQFLEDSEVSTFAKTILDDSDAATVRATIGAGTSSLTLGTTSTTALAGNTTIPSGNQIIDWTTDQGSTNIHTGNYNNTQLSNSEVVAAVVASTSISTSDKSTFRSNIGAGTSSLALGTTSTTALAGNTTVDDVSIANLKTRLAGGFGSNAVQIGDSSDTVTIPGNLVVTGTQTISNETVQVVENNTILFEGATADDFETKLTVEDPTADRVITLPNATGTVALTTDLTGQITKKISGDASTTSFNITHSFGTPIVSVTLLEYGDNGTGATYEQAYADIVRNSDNAVTISFAAAPSAAQDYLALISKFPAIS